MMLLWSLCRVFLQRATCGNMKPVSKVGVLFACPEFTEFDPSRTMTFPPRPESCCKVSSSGMSNFYNIELLTAVQL
jgi:hypothetical protein